MPKTSLDASEIQHVLVEKSILLQAEKYIGGPWQAMAAIWYRESFSIAPPKTPGAQFQFAPPDPAISLLKALLVRYTTNLSADEIQVITNQGVDNFPQLVSLLLVIYDRWQNTILQPIIQTQPSWTLFMDTTVVRGVRCQQIVHT
jgi:hypothetical protein